MNKDTVKFAMSEAKRFLMTAEAWQKLMKDEAYPPPSREGGAVKRASMDLTRALSDLRKPS